ncbi:hypothetical protein [Desulfosediminicola ganghwensis]|uniref:hypothetical protein n=1 Tax=Desulfosediminicola ganghwensis TaxID=2569540 RepID=UPI0010AC1B62|nr:hypothetical protein [Desulfosediminicola ganghwensis]
MKQYDNFRWNIDLRKVRTGVGLVLLLSGLSGCADWQGSTPLPVASQLEAIKNEQDQRYLEAFTYWKQAEQVVNGKLDSISSQLKTISEEHAKQAVVFYREKKSEEACREFIEALRFDPSNRTARDYLLNRYEVEPSVSYIVQESDTIEKIASKVYGDPGYEFLLTMFSGVDASKDLVEGATLLLADPEAFSSQAVHAYKKDILVARKLFKSNRYEEALRVSYTILEYLPKDDEASYITNMSLLKLAEIQIAEQKYGEAVASLSNVDPSFKNVKKELMEVQELQQEKMVWDKILEDYELVRQGEDLYRQGEFLEALKVFEQVDPQYAGREQMLAQVREQLRRQAENHFKEGVTLFVEEKLSSAIKEWERALEYNPNHPEALSSIEKARKLMEKVSRIN